jgi:hypothetical protein
MPSEPTVSNPRRDGLYLNVDALDHEVAIRAITIRTLVRKGGIPEETISRARHGRRSREATLRKLVDALKKFPILDGAEILVGVAPAKSIGVVATYPRSAQKNGSPARQKKEVRRASGRTSKKS